MAVGVRHRGSIVAFLALGLAGCGGSNGDSDGGATDATPPADTTLADVASGSDAATAADGSIDATAPSDVVSPTDVVSPADGSSAASTLRAAFHRAWRTTGTGAINGSSLRLGAWTDGDAVVSGSYSSGFDPGNGPVAGSGGAFVARFGPDGTVRWVRTGQPVNTSILETLADGDLVVAENNSVARLRPDGVDRWRVSFGRQSGRLNEAWTRASTTDAQGNIVIGGILNGAADLGGGLLIREGQPGFIAKYSPTGQHLWSRAWSATPSMNLSRIAITADNGVVFTGGYYGANVDFGGGALPAASSSVSRLYVAKFNASGAHQWSVSYGVPNRRLEPSALAVDADGSLVVLARYENGTLIDLGQGPLSTQPAPGLAVMRLSGANGSLTSARGIDWAGVSADNVNARNGTLYLTGTLARPANLGGGTLGGTYNPSAPTQIGYVVESSPSGNVTAQAAWPGRIEMSPQVRLVQIEGIGLASGGSAGLWWLAGYMGPVDLGNGVTLADSTARSIALVRFTR